MDKGIEQNQDTFQILTHNDLMKRFGIKRTTLFKLLGADILPVVKIGKSYYTTEKLMEEWFDKMKGHELFL